MENAITSINYPIKYLARFREYYFSVLDYFVGLDEYFLDTDVSHTMQLIYYCPFCDSKLPTSLRDEWFAELERNGLTDESTDIPEEMNNDGWWKKKGL